MYLYVHFKFTEWERFSLLIILPLVIAAFFDSQPAECHSSELRFPYAFRSEYICLLTSFFLVIQLARKYDMTIWADLQSYSSANIAVLFENY